DCYISSELPVFLDLRVRYLSSCGRGSEAAALAKCCVRHPTAGQLLFFLQVYLSWLLKTGQHDRLCKEFCVELCANALRSRLPCDVLTKTFIYKTIAVLLPSDLEVCRACALLVFFLERTVESYKMVYLLYMHPDQEYHVDDSPIGNNVRFETLQVENLFMYVLMGVLHPCLQNLK
ncbi:hypothetical protein XENOCAPTIV_003990, partial [Xenoophorus captivus]